MKKKILPVAMALLGLLIIGLMAFSKIKECPAGTNPMYILEKEDQRLTKLLKDLQVAEEKVVEAAGINQVIELKMAATTIVMDLKSTKERMSSQKHCSKQLPVIEAYQLRNQTQMDSLQTVLSGLIPI